jgi:hypothetical protein
MGRIKGESVPGLISVGAITDDFGLAILQEKSDRDLIGTRLRAKQTDEFVSLAGRAEKGMRLIEREATILQPPDESTLQRTYEQIKLIHAKAYGWNPPEIAWADAATSRQLRSHVRRWVNEWDLRRLYPDAEISTDEEVGLQPTYEQDLLLELAPQVEDEE